MNSGPSSAGSQPSRTVHKVFIAGNHDFLFQDEPEVARALIPEGVTYLENSGVVLEGIRFWGSPVTPQFQHWAFMHSPDTIGQVWNQVPADVEVLLTHGPPLGRMDVVMPSGQPVGCPQLRRTLDTRLRPRLHVFGHIHEGYGQVDVDGRISVNASSCDRRYRPVNAPIVVDL